MSKSSLDDFDMDDDDFDDLLKDDDDDSLAKKKKPTEKILSPTKSPQKSTKMSQDMKKVFQLDSSPEESPEVEKKMQNSPTKTQSPVKTPTNLSSKNEKQKSSPFENDSSLLSPSKSSKSKLDLFMEDESKYLEELSLDKLEKNVNSPIKNIGKRESPKKTLLSEKNETPKKSTLKRKDSEFSDGDDDILGDLDKSPSVINLPKESKSSFLDDLFSNSKETKKNPQKEFSSVLQSKYQKAEKEKKNEDDDIFGSYVPSSSKKSSSARRRSVKFEDELPSESPNENILPRRPQTSTPKTETITMKNDDDDWLGLLRKDSKSEIMKNVDLKGKSKDKSEVSPARRKSSNADWLGLGESPVSSPKMPSKAQSSSQINKDSGMSGKQLTPKTQLPWHSTPSSNITLPIEETRENTNDFMQQNVAESIPVQNESTISAGTIPSRSVQKSFPPNQNTISIDHIPQSPALLSVSQPPSVSQLYSVPSVSQPYSVSSIPLLQTANTDIMTFQTMISTLQFEKEHLSKTVEELRKRQDEDTKAFQDAIEKQKKSLEETFDHKLQSNKAEHETALQVFKRQIESLEDEKKMVFKESRAKFENMEKEYKQQLEKLKELHNDAILLMKRDHDEALSRLRELKDREIEAISSTEVHAKSLQTLTDQLGQRASELASLQVQVNEKHQTALQEKQAALQAKEQELKALENRLRWQIEEGDQERIRLQQLVLRLESRIQQHTKENEEDRWLVQQTKVKLEVQQKYLEEEKKTHLESMEKEKERYRKSQDLLVQEQKVIFQQIAAERQQLILEKRELELLSKRVKEEESKFNIKKMKDESMLEGQRLALQYEEDKLREERELTKQESQQLATERQWLNRDKKQAKEEKEKLEEGMITLKRRSNEVEALASKVMLEKEEAKSLVTMAHKIEANNQTKLDQITQQLQSLIEKEKELIQEKGQIVKLNQELDEKRSSILCSKCKITVGLPITALPPNFTQHPPAPTYIPTVANFQTYPNVVDPSLMVWYLTGQKDREYLEHEIDFLQSLKDHQKNPHNKNF